MRTLAKGLATLVIAAGVGLVDAETATAQSPGVLTFASTQSQSEQSPQTASGGAAGIDFTGSLTTGTPCYTVTASHTTEGNNVTVTVTATATGGICAQVITHNNYTGRVSALLPGSYNFTVLHVYRGTTTTAFSGTVTVQ